MPRQVAAVMIARNEERCIARALASVRPWVDEMVVLDTGSTDRTVALAVAAGARVATLPWPDDFAAARNAALDLAGPAVALMIDADEWVHSGGECLRAWPDDVAGLVSVHSQGAEASVVDAIARIVPPGGRFEGRIHEQLVWDRHGMSPLVLGHDGYQPQVRLTKQGRNERLLRLAVAAEEERRTTTGHAAAPDGYLRYQLGRELAVSGRAAEAVTHLERAWREGDPGAPWRHDLVVRLMHISIAAGATQVGLRVAAVEAERWPDSPDVPFVLAELILHSPQVPDGPEKLALVRGCWERCLAVGERPDLPGSVPGRGSTLAEHNLRLCG